MKSATKNKADPGKNSDVEKVSGGEKIMDGDSQKREDAGARKERKSQNIVFFQCFVARSKPKLAKAAGAEPALHMKDEKLHAVVAQR